MPTPSCCHVVEDRELINGQNPRFHRLPAEVLIPPLAPFDRTTGFERLSVLALGSFAIGSHAFGVMVGAPAVTLAAARMNCRSLLIGLMLLFAGGNFLSAFAVTLGQFSVVRFLSGLPQGAYFGAMCRGPSTSSGRARQAAPSP